MASPIENTLQLEPQGVGRGVNETDQIDSTVASPVLLLTGLSIVWLLVSSALQLILSWKLHAPGFLGDSEWFTYGRVEAAQSTAFLYGWATSAGLAIAVWLNARLARSATVGGALVSVAAVFWTIGVALSVVGVLAGDATGLPSFEIPRYAAPILFVAFAVIAAWVVQTVKSGKSTSLYVSQWYLLAALFSFAWLISIAQVTLLFFPVRGTLQAVVQSWYAGGIYLLWLMPIGLAVVYYLMPKLGGRVVHDYFLSSHGFWWLFAFGGFVGVGSLAGGPVPAWVQAAGIAGGLMLLVPAFALIWTIVGSLVASLAAIKAHASGRFIIFSVVCFVLSILWTVVAALPSVGGLVKFSLAAKALAGIGLYGSVSMAFFGGIYYFIPKVVGAKWSAHGLSDVHFWASTTGFFLSTGALLVVGLRQSSSLANANVSLMTGLTGSSSLLFAASCGVVLMTIGHVAFFLGFLGVARSACPCCSVCSTELSPEVAAR